MNNPLLALKIFRLIIFRPKLWSTALGLFVTMLPEKPSKIFEYPGEKSFIGFRIESFYGDPAADIPSKDLLEYLWWLKRCNLVK
jgi:hypothetical protein